MPFSSWLRAAAVYGDRRVLALLFLGFSSGLPLALTGSTLQMWLAEGGVSKTEIGLFALVGLPYSLKFLWAPVVDWLRLPGLSRRFGRRRAWALAGQLGLALSLLAMSTANPLVDPWMTAALAVAVAFCAATQDIVIDAFRVDSLDPGQYGAGSAIQVLGYRLGMLTSGAGALLLASLLPWALVYQIMATFVGVGMATVLLIAEPPAPEMQAARAVSPDGGTVRGLRGVARSRLYLAVVAPFLDFVTRPVWPLILIFIIIFKFGDVLAGLMTMPFYYELGFSKVEIASITKVFGLVATIAGGLVGGILVQKLGIARAILITGCVQMLSNLMFAVLAATGRDLGMLALTIGVENISGGMATAAFVAYLSSLCNRSYTATQYALLSSLFAFARDILGASAGVLADQLDWVSYFLVTTLAALPGLGLFLLILALTRGGAAGATAGRVAVDAAEA